MLDFKSNGTIIDTDAFNRNTKEVRMVPPGLGKVLVESIKNRYKEFPVHKDGVKVGTYIVDSSTGHAVVEILDPELREKMREPEFFSVAIISDKHGL